MDTKWNQIIKEFLENQKDVSEIEANGTRNIFLKEKGERLVVEDVFDSPEEYLDTIIDLIKLVDPKVTEVPKYIFEGRLNLSEGRIARCHIVLPPASEYPQVTIAKKTENLTTIEALFESGAMSTRIYQFLIGALKADLNIVVSGSSGSGKTTLLEALTKHWNDELRIGVAEDSPELRLNQPNVTYLKSSPWQPGREIKDAANLDWVVQQLNRMRVDKIIVGETRSSELFYFIQAANSGCDGSLTTLHATTPRMCLQKMTQFVLTAMPQPIRVANQSIASTIDVIIQLKRFNDGRYRVIAVEEISDTLNKDESAAIATSNLSYYNEHNDTWSDTFLISDKLATKFADKGINPKSFN